LMLAAEFWVCSLCWPTGLAPRGGLLGLTARREWCKKGAA
jgi:hypothetical protein